MPSAVRQRLPADLWRQRKSSSGSPVSMYHEMQASPGHSDTMDEHRHGNKRHPHRTHKWQSGSTGRGSPRNYVRKGSVDYNQTSDIDSGSDSSTDCCDRPSVLSSSVKSDTHVASKDPDAYAMESLESPHPSQLPFPPLEWLKSSSKRSVSPEVCGMSLKAMLGCQIAT